MKILDRVSLYYSSSWRWDHQYSATGDDGGDVVSRTTHFYSQKIAFGTGIHDGIFGHLSRRGSLSCHNIYYYSNDNLLVTA